MGTVGKRNTFLVGSTGLLACVCTWWVVDEHSPPWQVYLVSTVFGFGLGATILVGVLMLPDVITDAAVADGGLRRETHFYA